MIKSLKNIVYVGYMSFLAIIGLILIVLFLAIALAGPILLLVAGVFLLFKWIF